MRRRLFIIVIFLLAGATVNVVVAWGCAAWSSADGSHIGNYQVCELQHLEQWWRDHAPAGITDSKLHPLERQELVRALVLRSFGAEYARGQTNHDVGNIRPRVASLRRGRFSWPCLAMEWSTWGRYRMEARDMLRAGGYELPLRPIWPGFAVNTLFYAAVLWLLIWGPFALRRLVRKQRGLCPACGYPVGGLATCTECGRPLPERAVV